jgi:hypothetical protein
MSWLRGMRRDYRDKQRMVQRLISWVYAQIIIPLLRIHFYVTESGQYGYALAHSTLRSEPTTSTPTLLSLAGNGSSTTASLCGRTSTD